MRWTPLSPDRLTEGLADRLARRPGIVRVAVDGPECAHAEHLVGEVQEALRARGRPSGHVPARLFWRDASVRLEHGHEDIESYLGWLDADALRREVLVPIGAEGTYLPSLRDPATNRSTREPVRRADAGTVLFVSGEFLLGLGLPFDEVIHLTMSPAARSRHTAADQAWTLPAHERYEAEVDPAALADVVVRLEDPRRPAVRGLS